MKIEMEQFDAGHYEQMDQIKYFIPNKIDAEWVWRDKKIDDLVESTHFKLGQLEGIANQAAKSVNVDLFMYLFVSMEATLSSRIEGIPTTLVETLMPKEVLSKEQYDDWQEVENYKSALEYAVNQLKDLPISARLLKGAHKILLQGVRGEGKDPGNFRKSAVMLRSSSGNAPFYPPPYDDVPDLMDDLARFLNNDEWQTHPLVRIAIAHYQFETIHPFLDGNGRIGRLLIPLYLTQKNMLYRQLLYASAYFEQNRTHYYDGLNLPRRKKGMTRWVRYFLKGIEQATTHSCDKLEAVLDLHHEVTTGIGTHFGRQSSSANELLHELFKKSNISVIEVAALCHVSYPAAKKLVDKMVNVGYLRLYTGGTYRKRYEFRPLLDIFDKG